MKYDDLFQAYSLQADLRTAVSNLRKFQGLFFSDAAKTEWNNPVAPGAKPPVATLTIVAGKQGHTGVDLDPEDTIFLEIEKRLQVRVRELAERLRRLGVDVPEAVLS